MNSRIRYQPSATDTNAQLSSQRTFDVNGVQYRVHINTLDNTYEIHNDVTNQIVATGTGTSLHSVKMKAKVALKGLGVTFEPEKRDNRVIAPNGNDLGE